MSNECTVATFFFATTTTKRATDPAPWRLGAFGATRQLLTCSASSGSRRGVPAPSTSRSLAPAAPPSRVWRRRALRGGPPSLGNLAPPCRRPVLLPGRGAPNSTGPSGTSAELSARFVSGAGPAPRGGCAQSWRALPSARAPAPLARPGRPSPTRRPSPRERASSVAEAAEIGICWPAARRRRAEGRAGREARAPARRPARDEDCTAARGATGPGPLHAEGGGRAGPRRPAAVRARLRRASEDEFLGTPVSWRVAECGCATGGRRSLGRRCRAGEAATRLSGACGRPRPRGPVRSRSLFCSHSHHSGDASGILKWERRSAPAPELRGWYWAWVSDPARKRERSVFSAGMEAGRAGRPALQLGCGKAPGFSLRPCELVHLLF